MPNFKAKLPVLPLFTTLLTSYKFQQNPFPSPSLNGKQKETLLQQWKSHMPFVSPIQHKATSIPWWNLPNSFTLRASISPSSTPITTISACYDLEVLPPLMVCRIFVSTPSLMAFRRLMLISHSQSPPSLNPFLTTVWSLSVSWSLSLMVARSPMCHQWHVLSPMGAWALLFQLPTGLGCPKYCSGRQVLAGFWVTLTIVNLFRGGIFPSKVIFIFVVLILLVLLV